MKICEVTKKPNSKDFVRKFAPWVAEQLGIRLPQIELLDQPVDTTFGQYDPESKSIRLVVGGRHPIDVLRTLAHELTHHRQDLQDNLPPGAGATGTDQENEANAEAGIMMRDFAKQNPEYFGLDSSSLAEHSDYKTNSDVDIERIRLATEMIEKYAQQLGIKFKFGSHFFKQVTLERGIGPITAEMILHAGARVLKHGLEYFKGKPVATSYALWDPRDENHIILEVFKNDENNYFVRSVVRDTKWYGDSQKLRI